MSLVSTNLGRCSSEEVVGRQMHRVDGDSPCACSWSHKSWMYSPAASFAFYSQASDLYDSQKQVSRRAPKLQ